MRKAQRIIQGVIFLSNKENNFSLCVKKVPILRMVTARCHPQTDPINNYNGPKTIIPNQFEN